MVSACATAHAVGSAVVELGIGRAAEPIDAVVHAAATPPRAIGLRVHAGRPERLALAVAEASPPSPPRLAASAAVAAVGDGEGAGRAGAVGGVADGRTHAPAPAILRASVEFRYPP